MAIAKVKTGKKARCKQELSIEAVLDISSAVNADTEVAKRGLKRTIEAVGPGGAEERNGTDAQPPCSKKPKKAVRKAAKQLMHELSELQTLLQEVQTSAQLEEALAALRCLQTADCSIQMQSEDRSANAEVHPPVAPVAAKSVSAPVTSVAAEAMSAAPIGNAAINDVSEKKRLKKERSVAAAAAQEIEAVSERSCVVAASAAPSAKATKSGTFKRNFATWPVIKEKIAVKRRKALCIEIEDGDSVLPPVRTFSELQVLPEWVDQALEENGWTKPTQIQSQALPVLMAGRNLIGVAQTGSGKTGAFLLPAVLHIDAQAQLTSKSPGPVVLILAPTRELAVQISEEADKLLKYSTRSTSHPRGMFSACFYGGSRKQDQLRQFTSSGRHFLVATPGRLADCVSSKDISLSRVTYVVLDEADRMLYEGFSSEVGQILSSVRPDRQVALFSATWPAAVQELAKAVMPASSGLQDACGPVRIRVGAPKASDDGEQALQAREGITQEVVVIDYPSAEWKKAEEEKEAAMEAHVRKVLTTIKDSKVLVFVNTKVLADTLSTKLWKDGFQADSMHGGRPQETRLSVLRRFRDGDLRLLVVTDVFSRGLDIPEVSHVVIYEMGETEDYIHRIGRTGRGVGATGHALVFFEYWPGSPGGAEELIGVLERSKQTVPDGLRAIVADVRAGKRPTR